MYAFHARLVARAIKSKQPDAVRSMTGCRAQFRWVALYMKSRNLSSVPTNIRHRLHFTVSLAKNPCKL